MLILSLKALYVCVDASLSRRKDANSQLGNRIYVKSVKSIKKEGC